MREIDYLDPLPLQVRKAASSWLREKANWTIWATITFALPVTSKEAFRTLRSALQLVARTYGDIHFWVAEVVERHKGIDGFHVHALIELGVGSSADMGALEDALRQSNRLTGRTRIERYDSNQGAPEYITKDVLPHLWLVCPRTGKCSRRKCLIEQGMRS